MLGRKRKKKKSKIRKWVEDIIFIGVTVILIRTFLIQAYRIPSGSMEPTLLIGDQLFACKFFYGIKLPFSDKRVAKIRNPRRGDIVIFRYPYQRKDMVKRCIALEGEVIEIRDKKVYINNKPLTEPYAHFKDTRVYPKIELPLSEYERAWRRGEFKKAVSLVRDNFGPVKIPKGCIFVMGDNRDYSYDSRCWGPLNKRWLLGKALIIHFSLDNKVPWYRIWKKIRWKRMGKIIK